MFRLSKLFWLHLLFIVLLFKNKLLRNPPLTQKDTWC